MKDEVVGANRVWKVGDDVDTDQIVPGRYAPYMLGAGQDVADFAFVEAHPDFNRAARPGDVLVAGANFGCGSSREYAPVALKRRGIGAIVAAGYARIFFRNAVNLGIPVYVAPDVAAAVADGAQATVDVAASVLTVTHADGTVERFELPPLPPFARAIIEAGGIVPYVRAHGRFPGEG